MLVERIHEHWGYLCMRGAELFTDPEFSTRIGARKDHDGQFFFRLPAYTAYVGRTGVEVEVHLKYHSQPGLVQESQPPPRPFALHTPIMTLSSNLTSQWLESNHIL